MSTPNPRRRRHPRIPSMETPPDYGGPGMPPEPGMSDDFSDTGVGAGRYALDSEEQAAARGGTHGQGGRSTAMMTNSAVGGGPAGERATEDPYPSVDNKGTRLYDKPLPRWRQHLKQRGYK